MTPRPPAAETAAARGAVLQWAMPARIIGCRMERRVVRGVVSGVAILGEMMGMLRCLVRGRAMIECKVNFGDARLGKRVRAACCGHLAYQHVHRYLNLTTILPRNIEIL